MTFCTAAQHWSESYRHDNAQKPLTGNHYLIADSHLGPWTAPRPFLDGWDPWYRYAGKIVELNGKLHIMGFLFYDKFGKFIGQVSDPAPLRIDEQGYLHMER